jgi:hypothetical protein
MIGLEAAIASVLTRVMIAFWDGLSPWIVVDEEGWLISTSNRSVFRMVLCGTTTPPERE